MGTRSLTHIKDGYGKTLVTLYKQFDGHFDSYGLDLAEFLSSFTVVNGISIGNTCKVANGAGCLAAQIVSHFKDRPGGYYIYEPDSIDCGEECIYTVTATEENQIRIKAEDCYDSGAGFEGTPEDYINNYKEQ